MFMAKQAHEQGDRTLKPVFQKLRQRLLASYLVVLAAMLGTFAIAVRVIFARSLANDESVGDICTRSCS
jgi:hypothetical protein